MIERAVPFATAAALAALLALSHGILKWVAGHGHGSFTELLAAYWPQIGAAVLIYVAIFLWYLQALRTVNLSLLYPLYTGLSVLFVFALGAAVFSEPTSGARIAGCVLIVAGLALVVR